MTKERNKMSIPIVKGPIEDLSNKMTTLTSPDGKAKLLRLDIPRDLPWMSLNSQTIPYIDTLHFVKVSFRFSRQILFRVEVFFIYPTQTISYLRMAESKFWNNPNKKIILNPVFKIQWQSKN